MRMFRKVFSQLDDADWLINQCDDRDYLIRLADATTEHELRNTIEDYWWAVRELLLHEREHADDCWRIDFDITNDDRPVYKAVFEIDNPEWFICECYNTGSVQEIIASMTVEQLREQIVDYWQLAHNLLRYEKHAAVVHRDMPSDAA